MKQFLLGIDIGSATVKMALVDAATGSVVATTYRKHGACQIPVVLDVLRELHADHGILDAPTTPYVTGSGAQQIASILHIPYVHEINALEWAMKTLHPAARTAIDLGGQDAKIIVWQDDPGSASLRKFTGMNDKCAGGTGATIERIITKLGIDISSMDTFEFHPDKVRPVSCKCGIFAETDVNSLQKQGATIEECVISLLYSIVRQNLTTLMRGRVPNPTVLLLGGPNTLCKPLRQCWQHALNDLWPASVKGPEDLVVVPQYSLLFSALGSAYWGKTQPGSPFLSRQSLDALTRHVADRLTTKQQSGEAGFASSGLPMPEFVARYTFTPQHWHPLVGHTTLFIGLDAGSTSTKAAAIDENGTLVASSYKLTEGNTIDEVRTVLTLLHRQIESRCKFYTVKNFVITGYAKDFLKPLFAGSSVVVETVAHLFASIHYYPETDVIVDIGGQDIKVLFVRNGVVYDFNLNTQCSAGNGFYLQNAAKRFGVALDAYADTAFAAAYFPSFPTGCAVFLESDIVHLQQQGWTGQEILAGLAAVLPKNVWEYVVQRNDFACMGTTFVLQGGAHRNAAVVKAHVDYLQQRAPKANIVVHRYGAEAGAVGAALAGLARSRDREHEGLTTTFNLAELGNFTCTIKRDAETICHGCGNRCMRTFISARHGNALKVTRHIIAHCPKGMADPLATSKAKADGTVQPLPLTVNYVSQLEQSLFSIPDFQSIARSKKKRNSIESLRIGIPRTLNMWRYAPLFTAYLRAAGVSRDNIVWSDKTSNALWEEGGRFNCADLCFPGKYGVAHVYNLLKKNVDLIINPALVHLDAGIDETAGSAACPVAMANPHVVKAAFTGTINLFAQSNTTYLVPILHFDNTDLFEKEMFESFGDALFLSRQANRKALAAARAWYDTFYLSLQKTAALELRRLVHDHRVGILFLGRPYHYDSGLNHHLARDLNNMGYPIFTIESLPRDPDFFDSLGIENKGDDPCAETSSGIDDVWKHSISENVNRKVWAAKFAATHPNLAIVDFVSFRCGPDATALHVIEGIARCSGTPCFPFHDMDQNRPTGSLKIRLETIDFFLKQYSKTLAVSPSRLPLVKDTA